MPYKVLVAFDFSVESERALAWAAGLQQHPGVVREMHVINVINPYPAAAMAAPVLPPLVTPDQMESLRKEMEISVAKVGATAHVEVLPEMTLGDAILGYAQRHTIDLIVMGTHGRGGLTRMALGSVADHVMRHANCPVVTMRSQGAK